jgi:hypothetical protein
MDMLVDIMPIHQTDTKHTFSSGMDFSLGVPLRMDEMDSTTILILLYLPVFSMYNYGFPTA